MLTKICTKCQIDKTIDNFNIAKNGKYNRRSVCIKCQANYTKDRNKEVSKINKLKIEKYNNETFICITCKEKKNFNEFPICLSIKSGYNHKCKSCFSDYRKKDDRKEKRKIEIEVNILKNKNRDFTYNETKICNVCKIEKLAKEFYRKNSTKSGITAFCKGCAKLKTKTKEYKIYKLEYMKHKIETDSIFKLIHNLRKRLRTALFLKSKKKLGSHIKLLGCTPEFLKIYIETQFLEGMSWENHGNIWQVDHIFPFSSFNLENLEELSKVCHYTNLQPLWKEINLAKKDMIVNDDWYIQRDIIRKRNNLPIYK